MNLKHYWYWLPGALVSAAIIILTWQATHNNAPRGLSGFVGFHVKY